MRRQLAGLALAVTLTGCGVSTQQEVEMGGQYAAQINQQLPIVQDPEANRYINLLGDSIARLTSRALSQKDGRERGAERRRFRRERGSVSKVALRDTPHGAMTGA